MRSRIFKESKSEVRKGFYGGNAEFYAFCTVMTGISPNDDPPIIMLKEMTQGGLKGVIP